MIHTLLNIIKQWLLNWIFSSTKIKIQTLHQLANPSSCEIYCDDELKFIERTDPLGVLVLGDRGYSLINHTHKTVPYKVHTLRTTGHILCGADHHLVINSDGREQRIIDTNVGDIILTDDGPQHVVAVASSNNPQHMYDLELDNRTNHLYYTNGILSHNSITSAAFLLWFSAFHDDKTILIASNKNSNAMEMISRIRYAYEHLPMWLKPGVNDDGWNKHNLAFDNGSRIISEATSESSGRGLSISLVFLDEFAFVKPSIQKEFWTSIAPTLSTGGSCIITSTPNGDSDIFATTWRGAQIPHETRPDVGHNGFAHQYVAWDEPPGRDEQFKQDEIAKLGEHKWRQEYECEFLSSEALLIDSVFLSNITHEINQRVPIDERNDVVFWKEIKKGGTYLVGVDPATGSGNDYSVISIFEFPDMIQVAQYRSNTMSTNGLYGTIKSLLLFLEKYETVVYFSVESNSVGEGVISLYEADEHPPMNSEFISESGKNRRGMVTTTKSKMRACVNMKEMLQRGSLNIRSPVLLAELKTYTRARGSYAAQSGSTDDCIAAVLIVVRIVEEIASFSQDAFDKLYAGHTEDVAANTWDGMFDGGNQHQDDEPDPMVF